MSVYLHKNVLLLIFYFIYLLNFYIFYTQIIFAIRYFRDFSGNIILLFFLG